MSDPVLDDRLDLNWSEWLSLDPSKRDHANIPSEPGIYLIRQRQRESLEYIGESGQSVRSRIEDHEPSCRKKKPSIRPASQLWEIRQEHGLELEVAYATPKAAIDPKQRCSMEAALIALYRRKMGKSPTCNFGPRAEESKSPYPWTNSNNVLSDNWMGLEWTKPQNLSDVLKLSPKPGKGSIPAQPGVYRLWWEDQAPPLEYLGQAFRLRRRLKTHRVSKDGDLHFSFARIYRDDGGYTEHKREEVEMDLFGAHWLACGEPPLQSFNRKC